MLRQVYGLDICLKENNTVVRYAYGLGKRITSEGTDPSRVMIKPFCDELKLTSETIHQLLLRNRNILKLQKVDLQNCFNCCVILQHCTINDLKRQCGMGWRCDTKYSKTGLFLPNSNTQLINSPVIIFTIEMSRVLKWRKRYLSENKNGNHTWHYNKKLEFKMLLEEGHFLLIHPSDEIPKYCTIEGAICNYQHGHVCFKDSHGMSIGYVFRNTTEIGDFNRDTNLWVQNQLEPSVPKDMYNGIDLKDFHDKMISKLQSMYGY